jgi:hypothetical protein
MFKNLAIVLVVLVFPASLARADSLPSGLRGKSVNLSWAMSWVTRNLGETTSRSNVSRHNLIIYVSSTGRIFSKRVVTSGSSFNSTMQVGEGAGRGFNALDKISFSGGALTILRHAEATGNATRLSASFDPSFGSCTLSVAYGLSSKLPQLVPHGTFGGTFEVLEASPGGTSCSVVAGNLFQ